MIVQIGRCTRSDNTVQDDGPIWATVENKAPLDIGRDSHNCLADHVLTWYGLWKFSKEFVIEPPNADWYSVRLSFIRCPWNTTGETVIMSQLELGQLRIEPKSEAVSGL